MQVQQTFLVPIAVAVEVQQPMQMPAGPQDDTTGQPVDGQYSTSQIIKSRFPAGKKELVIGAGAAVPGSRAYVLESSVPGLIGHVFENARVNFSLPVGQEPLPADGIFTWAIVR